MSKRNYLILGASSGIGLELTKILSERGDDIIALSRTFENLINMQNVIYHPCDIAHEAPEFPQIDEPLDGLVYCPGTINLKSFPQLKLEDFHNDFNINLIGAVKTLQNYLPQLKKGDGPSVVLISSVAALRGLSFHASIAAAKGAIASMTRALAAEFAPEIRFNAIAPSLTNTPLAQELLNGPAKQEGAKKRHPLQRYGEPHDIAAIIAFLLSKEASWLTGQVISVDGGLSSL